MRTCRYCGESNKPFRPKSNECMQCAGKRIKQWKVAFKAKVFSHYGTVCYCCKESEPRFLTIEHLNDDGAAHRKVVGAELRRSPRGFAFYEWLYKNNYPQDLGLAVACWNCNSGRLIGEDCPHKTKKLTIGGCFGIRESV